MRHLGMEKVPPFQFANDNNPRWQQCTTLWRPESSAAEPAYMRLDVTDWDPHITGATLQEPLGYVIHPLVATHGPSQRQQYGGHPLPTSPPRHQCDTAP